MTFVTAQGPDAPSKFVAQRLADHLRAGHRVLWLISGGSAIDVAVLAAGDLAKPGLPLENLVVSLIDERYGEPGHPNSNWSKLLAAGFELPGATLYPVLPGGERAAAAEQFEAFLAEELGAADFALGLLGIGTDGHTSGILPHSPAVSATGLVTHYDGPDFERITTTRAALERLDEAVVLALGEEKWRQLATLEGQASVAEQPAQMLKKIPALTIYTDRPES